MSKTKTAGRTKGLIWSYFTEEVTEDGFKKVRCHNCDQLVSPQSTRMHSHRMGCLRAKSTLTQGSSSKDKVNLNLEPKIPSLLLGDSKIKKLLKKKMETLVGEDDDAEKKLNESDESEDSTYHNEPEEDEVGVASTGLASSRARMERILGRMRECEKGPSKQNGRSCIETTELKTNLYAGNDRVDLHRETNYLLMRIAVGLEDLIALKKAKLSQPQ